MMHQSQNTGRRNRTLVPEARQALDHMKFEIANQLELIFSRVITEIYQQGMPAELGAIWLKVN